MSMSRPKNHERPLSPEDAFQVTLLVNAEMTKNIILQFNSGGDKLSKYRRNLLQKIDNLIELLNQTYEGHVPVNLKPRYDIYYQSCEASMNTLLKAYRHAREESEKSVAN